LSRTALSFCNVDHFAPQVGLQPLI
jgi:hypothetical protein